MIDQIVPQRDEEEMPAKRRRWFNPLRLIAWLFGSVAIVSVAAVVAVAIYLAAVIRELPSSELMRDYQPPIMTRIHAGDGSLIAEFARERRLFVPLDVIPQQVIDAFIAAEDKNFFEHPGVDYQGVIRAALANIDNIRNGRRLEGASTITQQVARNFFLTSEVSFERKLKEALIALRLEQTFSKEYILELYLNEIYLGWRSYGVAAAALNYFDKSLEDLALAETAYLAALPKAPNNYHPIRKRSDAIARRNWVLDRMEANGFISPATAAAAKREDLVTFDRPVGVHVVEAEYFTEEVRRQLYKMYDEQGLYDGGLSVRTTLDTEMQRWARDALRFGLTLYDRRHGWRGPYATISITDQTWLGEIKKIEKPSDLVEWEIAVVLETSNEAARIGFQDGKVGQIPFAEMKWARPWARGERVGAAPRNPGTVVGRGDVVFVESLFNDTDSGIVSFGSPRYALRQIPAVNGAIIAIDPHTGRILAMVGGFSYFGSEFNRATQAMRQPGSAFKPIVYSAALDHGYTPISIILDGPLVVDQGPGLPLWKPKNYSGEIGGETLLRTGIEKSRNLMTARLAMDMGLDSVVEYAARLGVADNLEPRPAMALGAGETTLMRMVGAYSVLVNGGKKVVPTFIDRIQDRYGKTIYRHDQRTCAACQVEEWANQDEPLLPDMRPQILDPRTAYQLVSFLEGAVQRGTGVRLKTLGKPLAGKTGTTNDSRDAWFLGFTPDLLVGAYVGFDQPHSLGDRETGSRVALPIVKNFFEKALEDVPGIPFRVPAGIILVRINAITGELAQPGDPRVILEAFKLGNEPSSERRQQRIVFGADGRPVLVSAPNTSLSTGTGGLY